jgi:hypothetical protein
LIKRLFKNKKGVAEVIGSVMFIIILLFFFTNVYLWHDTATKEMNDLQVQKIHTKIDASIHFDGTTGVLRVTNNAAIDVSLSMLWVNEKSAAGIPDAKHQSFDLNSAVIAPGDTFERSITYNPTGTVVFRVITGVGTIEPCSMVS